MHMRIRTTEPTTGVLLSFIISAFGLVSALAGLPEVRNQAPPTPTPFVRSSPVPGKPLLPPPGRPLFSVVTRDEGDHYNVYATIGNASPKDVRVTISAKELKLVVPPAKRDEKPAVKLVTMPDDALPKLKKIARGEHTLTVTIPKAKK